MCGIHVGVQQAYRHRLDAFIEQASGNGARLLLVHCCLDLAPCTEPLAQFEAQSPGHQRGRFVVLQVVHHRDTQPAHFEHIAKTLGRDQGRFGAFVFQDGIGGDGCCVDHGLDVARVYAEGLANLGQGDQDGAAVVVRRGRNLERSHLAIAAQHNVGEGAADVAAQDVTGHGRILARYRRQRY